MFDAGAGSIGDYEQCCWQTQGEGQFKPMRGSNPYMGAVHQLEKVKEFLVEMVCEKQLIKEALAAMKSAHPYEEPAFGVLEILTFNLEHP